MKFIECILAIFSAVVAGGQSHIASVGFIVIVAAILHNGIGLLGGYWGGRRFGFDESTCRTLAIEVGMQNSGLSALPGALFFRMAQPFRLPAGRLLVRKIIE